VAEDKANSQGENACIEGMPISLLFVENEFLPKVGEVTTVPVAV
jgi:hypothetical protein